MNEGKLYGLRGAVCTSNTIQAITADSVLLFKELLEKNSLVVEDIVSVLISVTPDITALNPATAIRKSGLAEGCALFCCAEAQFTDSLPQTVRVLVTAYLSKKPVPIYLNGAEVLRPDLCDGKHVEQKTEQ